MADPYNNGNSGSSPAASPGDSDSNKDGKLNKVKNIANMAKDKMGMIADWILSHSRIVMPLILVVCVALTVLIALNANERSRLREETTVQEAIASEAEASQISLNDITVPDIPLEENQYPEVNKLINTYYTALAEGDIETAVSIDIDLNSLDQIRAAELAKYIDRYESIDVYTKPGLTEDSFVTYVYGRVRFTDVDAVIPGFQTYYVMRNEKGSYVIRKKDLDENIYEYVQTASLQDDVVELNNKIAVEYNELIASNQELEEFIAYMSGKIEENVGVILAQNEQPDITADTIAETAEGTEGTDEEELQVYVSVELPAKTTDVVNIRSSDSETADRIGRAELGQEFTVLEQRGNGWSRVEYEDGDAFIKSEYLEIIETEPIAEEEPDDAEEEADSEADAPAASASQITTNGTVKVKESVRIRSTPGTDGDILATVYAGEELDLVEEMSNGWTKVKYDGQIGYVKTEYVE